MQDISLDMFAKDMYLNQVSISKIFEEEIGSSLINLISGQIGYEDVYHFSILFKNKKR